MKNIVLTILLLIAIGCKAQINNNLNKENMKYFNENNFKDWEKDTYYSSSDWRKFLKKGDQLLEIVNHPRDLSIRYIPNIHKPYEEIYVYSQKTKECISYTKKIYNITMKTKKYDENGKFLEEIDWNKFYKISIEELIFISKNKLGIDLMDMSLNLMLTRVNHTQPVYVIGAPLHPEIREIGMRYITISGSTGQILFDKEIYSDKEYNENSQEIYQMKESTPSKKESKFYLEDDEYQKHLKDKKK